MVYNILRVPPPHLKSSNNIKALLDFVALKKKKRMWIVVFKYFLIVFINILMC